MTTRIVKTMDVSAVVDAILLQVEQWPDFDGKVRVEASEPITSDPSKCPWVGVYRVAHQLPSRTVGAGSGYRQHRFEVALVAKQASLISGRDCSAKLDALTNGVMDSLLSDESLRGTVDVLDQFRVSYDQYTRDQRAFMQEATVVFEAVRNVSVNYI